MLAQKDFTFSWQDEYEVEVVLDIEDDDDVTPGSVDCSEIVSVTGEDGEMPAAWVNERFVDICHAAVEAYIDG